MSKVSTEKESANQDNMMNDISGMAVESNISKQITERTTKIVIIVILSSLFLLPFFEINTFKSYKSSLELGYNMLTDFYEEVDKGKFSQEDYQKLVDYYVEYHKDYKFELFKYDLPNNITFESEDINDLRTDEYEAASGSEEFVAYQKTKS